MQLSQLEAVRAIAKNDYNMSVAAGMLNRSQSGLSRQIKELERELGFRIFTRTRNNISGLTSQGEEVLRIGQRMLSDADDLRQVSSRISPDGRGELKVVTSDVLARYTLPPVVKSFSGRFPQIMVAIQEMDPVACCRAVTQGETDLAITSVPRALEDRVAAVPAFALASALFVPKGHPLTKDKTVTLRRLAEFPLIAAPQGYGTRAALDRAFQEAGLRPRVVSTATGADACKKYVEAGIGVAILSKLVFDEGHDSKLAMLDVDGLLEPVTVHVALRKQAFLSRAMYAFINAWAPHIGQQTIRRTLQGTGLGKAALRAGSLPVLGAAA
jgi:LysR family cys regulon transcriptional activator